MACNLFRRYNTESSASAASLSEQMCGSQNQHESGSDCQVHRLIVLQQNE